MSKLRWIFILSLIEASSAWAECRHSTMKLESYQDLVDYIAANKVRDLTDLIECFPSEYQDNYLLVYKSRSPEKEDVDPLNPRVIAFGRTGKLTLAYTGKSDGKHFNKLQIIENTSDGNHFFQLDFTNEDSLNHSIANSDPDSCVTCHRRNGKLMKPIMEDYPIWDGFYGAFDDTFLKPPQLIRSRNPYSVTLNQDGIRKDGEARYQGKLTTPGLYKAVGEKIKEETLNYEKYEALRKNKPRYRGLALFSPMKELQRSRAANELNRAEPTTSVRPNLRFVDLIVANHLKIILKKFLKTKSREKVSALISDYCKVSHEQYDELDDLRKQIQELIKGEFPNDLDFSFKGSERGIYETPFADIFRAKSTTELSVVNYFGYLLMELDPEKYRSLIEEKHRIIQPGYEDKKYADTVYEFRPFKSEEQLLEVLEKSICPKWQDFRTSSSSSGAQISTGDCRLSEHPFKALMESATEFKEMVSSLK